MKHCLLHCKPVNYNVLFLFDLDHPIIIFQVVDMETRKQQTRIKGQSKPGWKLKRFCCLWMTNWVISSEMHMTLTPWAVPLSAGYKNVDYVY